MKIEPIFLWESNQSGAPMFLTLHDRNVLSSSSRNVKNCKLFCPKNDK